MGQCVPHATRAGAAGAAVWASCCSEVWGRALGTDANRRERGTALRRRRPRIGPDDPVRAIGAGAHALHTAAQRVGPHSHGPSGAARCRGLLTPKGPGTTETPPSLPLQGPAQAGLVARTFVQGRGPRMPPIVRIACWSCAAAAHRLCAPPASRNGGPDQSDDLKSRRLHDALRGGGVRQGGRSFASHGPWGLEGSRKPQAPSARPPCAPGSPGLLQRDANLHSALTMNRPLPTTK